MKIYRFNVGAEHQSPQGAEPITLEKVPPIEKKILVKWIDPRWGDLHGKKRKTDPSLFEMECLKTKQKLESHKIGPKDDDIQKENRLHCTRVGRQLHQATLNTPLVFLVK